MKILITGMTGFVGAAITKRLFHSGHELIGLVRHKDNLPDEVLDKFKIVVADISKNVPPIDCDLVIHTAATVSDKVLSVIMNQTNVDGTRRVLEATGNAKIIYLSSASVYNLTEKTLHEDDEIIPKLLTPYGRSKYNSEQIIQNEFRHRDAIILRPRNIYGKGDRVLLPSLFKIYKDGVIKVPGDLDQKTTMTHIEFLTEAIEKMIAKDFNGQHIYNVVDYNIYNLRENMTSLLGTLFSREIKVRAMNEHLVRIIAGFRTVLIPGNLFTQYTIDYITRDYIISFDKLKKDFPELKSPHYIEYIPEYVKWINNIGVSTLAQQKDPRVVWL